MVDYGINVDASEGNVAIVLEGLNMSHVAF
jgi:hypothetical protein